MFTIILQEFQRLIHSLQYVNEILRMWRTKPFLNVLNRIYLTKIMTYNEINCIITLYSILIKYTLLKYK